MKENFKIEKELLFKNNIKEITSISLDRDYKITNNEIVGNFIINGDYKIHEVSINREKFNFKIPFKHSITNDIDKDSINLEITDFVYDYNKDDLLVNIEYEIVGDRKDILIFDNEETLDEFLNKREVEVIDTRIDSIKENLESVSEFGEDSNVIILPNISEKNSVENCEGREELSNIDEDITISDQSIERNNNTLNKDENNKISKEEIEEKLNLVDEEERNMKTEEIINNVSSIQDKFVTYKIYKVSQEDTLESIVLKYHTSVEEIKEYNELSNINVGDKIIIPINE